VNKTRKPVIESGLSTGKRTQYDGPGTDTVMPQVTALECAMPGMPPRPGLQWREATHHWVRPSVTTTELAQKAQVAFKPAPVTSHTYAKGSGVMAVREDSSERTKFHALAHVLDKTHSISNQMDNDGEMQVERDRLEAEIRQRGNADADPASAEEQLAEAFGRWMTDPEFEDTFPEMVAFMHEHMLSVLDVKKQAVMQPPYPGQPAHAQYGKAAGYVEQPKEVLAETSHKRPQIAPPVQQLKRVG